MNSSSPLSVMESLYEILPDHVFYGLMPLTGKRLPHAEGQVVAVFEPPQAEGYTCVVTETRMPASFWAVEVSSPATAAVKFSTGSGNDIGRLLRRLCEAFQHGAASLDPELFLENFGPAHFNAQVQEDGRPCEVVTLSGGWYGLCLDESSGLLGRKPAKSFCVRDKKLALRLATAIGEGMLDLRSVPRAQPA